MSFIYNLTDTWNAAGTVFTAIKMSVTNTASAAGSKLLDLMIDGVSMITVDKTGKTTIADNLVIGTSGKGIDFSATTDAATAGASMTSELFADYEEGTWTPNDASGAGLALAVVADSCLYTRIGRKVFVEFDITYPVTADATATLIGGLPFTSKNTTSNGINNCGFSFTSYTASWISSYLTKNATTFGLRATGQTSLTNANVSGKVFRGGFSYTV